MNAFNRLAMVLVLLGTAGVLAIGILTILLFPADLGRLLANVGRSLSDRGPESRLAGVQLELTLFGLALFVPVMVLLWLEVRRSSRDAVRISKVSGGEAHLSMQAVAQSLAYFIDALPGVVRIRPHLTGDDKGVNVRLDVETVPDVDVRIKTEEIAKTARATVEERLGLTLKRLQIEIHHAAYPRAGTARPAPLVAAPPAIQPTTALPPASGTATKDPLL